MPELPEVESARSSLERTVVGKTITAVDVLTPSAVRTHSPERFARLLKGRRVQSVERRGKMLLWHLSGGWVLTFHFKLWGLLRFRQDRGAGDHQTAAVIRFRGGSALEFRELQLSSIELHRETELGGVTYLATLGIEPRSKKFTRTRFNEILSARGNLRALLTDQTRIAGIGNLWAHEILHEARLRPDRKAGSLSPEESRRLYTAIKQVLRKGTARGGEPEFEDAMGRKGTYPLAVYGRDGRRCPRGDGTVKLARLGGRPSFFCPACQH